LGKLLRTYIEILGINVAMLREVEVLLGHEHAFAEEVLVDLLAVSFWDKPCEKMSVKATFWDLHVLTLLRVPCALRGIAHNAGVVLGLTKVVVTCDGRSSEQYLNVRLKSCQDHTKVRGKPRDGTPDSLIIIIDCGFSLACELNYLTMRVDYNSFALSIEAMSHELRKDSKPC
jgi:hypothetical protein